MKKLEGLTQFFTRKMNNQNLVSVTQTTNPEIQKLVNKLIDLQKCYLCRQKYGLQQNFPQILVNCGHTFCSNCLSHFHIQKKIRCPMCLKLIKNIDEPELLPKNHTIMKKLLKQKYKKSQNNNNTEQNINKNIDCYLYSDFQNSLKTNLELIKPPKQNKQQNLSYCVYHPQNLQHYLCMYHDSPGCKVCMNQAHTFINQCKIVDVLQIKQQHFGCIQSNKYKQLSSKKISSFQQIYDDSSSSSSSNSS